MSCLQSKNFVVQTLLRVMEGIKGPDMSSSVEDNANDETALAWN